LQIPSLAKLHKASGPEHHDLHSFFARLTKPAFNESRNYFATNIGMVLSALPRFLKLKRKIEPLLYALADIDALVSIATLYKEHQNTKQVYSFARFLHGESAPTLFVDEFWHPNLSPNIAIDNSLFIGGETIKRNIILTGPNAAGKSTISKGLLLSALLGQTLTITPARTLHFTPFARINTSLNIVEDPEKRTSQHRAETRRTAELISEITSLEPGRFSFTIMDEMLRITNPLTGSAAAYGIAKELGKVPNSILVLATHFNNLPRLGEEVESSFENYRVTASEQEDGSFKYPYKIEKGINNNIIALALLANKGFNKDIIATAYDHLAYLGDHNKSNSSMTRMLKDMRDKMATAKKASSH
jgi:DNA mismatch repair protein MutS